MNSCPSYVVLAHCEDIGFAVLVVDVLATREGPIEEEHFVVWYAEVYVCRPSDPHLKGG